MFSAQMRKERGFTLIELLVVIAIIAVLAVVVILTLNPAQLLAQSRDSQRLSDMATLQSALNLYTEDQSGASSFSLGTATTSYLSIPDVSSSCADLGMPSSSYAYQCSSSSTYRGVFSAGWIPVDLASSTAGSPLGALPVDPVNQTSSDLYYTYSTNGFQYQVNAFLESSKYAKSAFNDGGSDPTLLESGSGATTMPDAGRGLVGYWPLNEANGATTAIDWSGGGNNATWVGTASGTNGFYSPGHVWAWGGYFNSSNNEVKSNGTVGALAGNFTVMAWINNPNIAGGTTFEIVGTKNSAVSGWELDLVNTGGSGELAWKTFNGAANILQQSSPSINSGSWYMVTAVQANGIATVYINGSPVLSGALANATVGSQALDIGHVGSGSGGTGWLGTIDDVRIYNRVLSPTEIQEIYSEEQ